jgi:hypothetical protein
MVESSEGEIALAFLPIGSWHFAGVAAESRLTLDLEKPARGRAGD